MAAKSTLLLLVIVVALFFHFIPAKTEKSFDRFLKSDHTNNWAVLVCTSRFWFNYRHVANVLSMYRSVKRLGIPDSHIIVMLADDMACNARNPRPGTVFNNANQHINVYGDDIEVDYRGYEVTVENFIRILTGRLPSSVPRSKRLLSDERSNILVYMTGHGGDGFLKFQDAEEITSIELADAFEQMWQKRRYNEVFLIVDTCQAYSMTQKLYSPNILAVGSSLVGEDSLSHHEDPAIGVHVIDRYTYYVLQFLEGVTPDSKATVQDLFSYTTPNLVISTPGVRSDLFRRDPNKVLVTDFFGSVHMVEITNSSTMDIVQEESVCRGESCPAPDTSENYESSETRALREQFPKAAKKDVQGFRVYTLGSHTNYVTGCSFEVQGNLWGTLKARRGDMEIFQGVPDICDGVCGIGWCGLFDMKDYIRRRMTRQTTHGPYVRTAGPSLLLS